MRLQILILTTEASGWVLHCVYTEDKMKSVSGLSSGFPRLRMGLWGMIGRRTGDIGEHVYYKKRFYLLFDCYSAHLERIWFALSLLILALVYFLWGVIKPPKVSLHSWARWLHALPWLDSCVEEVVHFLLLGLFPNRMVKPWIQQTAVVIKVCLSISVGGSLIGLLWLVSNETSLTENSSVKTSVVVVPMCHKLNF